MFEKVEILFNGGSVIKVTAVKQASPKATEKSDLKEDAQVDKDKAPIYLATARFLKECHQHLMSRNTEVLHSVSGVRHNGLYTLDRLEHMELDRSSPTYAKSDLRSTIKVLTNLHQHGELLTGIFHSHPWHGRSAVNPSSTDIKNQKKHEDAGYRNVSAVFSRDGWVRFFTAGIPFEIRVEGKGVERVTENLFRLTETEEI